MAWFEGFDHQTLEVRGLPVTFRRSSDWATDKPVLVLLHGFPQTHVMWHRVALQLQERYRLVMPDLRGYGDSSHATGDAEHAHYSKRAMAQEVVDLLDPLGVQDFYLCGHDRGGRVAHRLAVDHPTRVIKLCVIDIAPTLDMYEATDFDFARAYYHWFHLIQPAPLPELMIGGNAKAYLHAKLGGWGSQGLGYIEPEALAEYERCFCNPALNAQGLPASIHCACERTTVPASASTCSMTAKAVPVARRLHATHRCSGVSAAWSTACSNRLNSGRRNARGACRARRCLPGTSSRRNCQSGRSRLWQISCAEFGALTRPC